MPKQLLLYQFLSWQAPKFAHLPLLRNPDHSKISKRKNPAARLLWFREEGFLPEALVNFLALQGWSMPDGREIFSFDDLVANFDVERFSPVGPIFDVDKLDWMNGKYIEALDDDELMRRVRPFVPGGHDESLRILAPVLKTRVRRLKEVYDQVDFLYTAELNVDREMLAGTGERLADGRRGPGRGRSRACTARGVFDARRGRGPQGRAGAARVEAEAVLHAHPRSDQRQDPDPAASAPMVAALGKERSLDRLRDAIDLLAPGLVARLSQSVNKSVGDSVEQVAPEKIDGQRVRDQFVLELRDLVALVFEAQKFHRAAQCLQAAHHLLRLADRHPRVVSAVDDQQRRADPFDVLDRGQLLEKLSVAFQAAVLGLAQVPAPGARVFEERHEIGDAHQVNAGRRQVR